MSKLNSNLVRKRIGTKILTNIEQPFQSPIMLEDIKKFVRDKNYITNGEKLIVVKDTQECELILDSNTTNHIIIKALTKVTIKPSQNFIDEFYEKIEINKGACVEFYLLENNWYIVSSDGLKLE